MELGGAGRCIMRATMSVHESISFVQRIALMQNNSCEIFMEKIYDFITDYTGGDPQTTPDHHRQQHIRNWLGDDISWKSRLLIAAHSQP
jgi:hypothetical protein